MIFPAEAEAKLIAAVRQIPAEVLLPRFRFWATVTSQKKSRMDDLVPVADREAERRLSEVAITILRVFLLSEKRQFPKTRAFAMHLIAASVLSSTS